MDIIIKLIFDAIMSTWSMNEPTETRLFVCIFHILFRLAISIGLLVIHACAAETETFQ